MCACVHVYACVCACACMLLCVYVSTCVMRVSVCGCVCSVCMWDVLPETCHTVKRPIFLFPHPSFPTGRHLRHRRSVYISARIPRCVLISTPCLAVRASLLQPEIRGVLGTFRDRWCPSPNGAGRATRHSAARRPRGCYLSASGVPSRE